MMIKSDLSALVLRIGGSQRPRIRLSDRQAFGFFERMSLALQWCTVVII